MKYISILILLFSALATTVKAQYGSRAAKHFPTHAKSQKRFTAKSIPGLWSPTSVENSGQLDSLIYAGGKSACKYNANRKVSEWLYLDLTGESDAKDS
jgi:hypothetical protein